MNQQERQFATEMLGWSPEQAEVIYDWAQRHGYWADWSEWTNRQLLEHFHSVAKEYELSLA